MDDVGSLAEPIGPAGHVGESGRRGDQGGGGPIALQDELGAPQEIVRDGPGSHGLPPRRDAGMAADHDRGAKAGPGAERGAVQMHEIGAGLVGKGGEGGAGA